MNNRLLRVGITHGDTNGIGYEIILKVLANPAFSEICTPVVYGSLRISNYYSKSMELEPCNFNVVNEASEVRDGVNNLVEVLGEEITVEPGVESKIAGNAALRALQRAVVDLQSGEIDVLVTAPINKHAIQSEAFSFPGHTEFLEAEIGEGNKALMIMCCDGLRVALVTGHIPVAEVAATIDEDLIVEKLRIFNRSLKEDFCIGAPKIAVLALNPHASDNGLIGDEEQTKIIPAIERAYAEKILCFGPYPADGFFGNGDYMKFDGVLAMYHDQGLIPFKTIAMESGVNFTAGLPYVRTSPDHGTGFNIAGKNMADEQSLRDAIYAAIDIYHNRKMDKEIRRNPLRKVYVDKGKDNVVLDLTKDEEEN